MVRHLYVKSHENPLLTQVQILKQMSVLIMRPLICSRSSVSSFYSSYMQFLSVWRGMVTISENLFLVGAYATE